MLNGNASTIEQLWSGSSLIAMLLHGWLSVQAWLDWRATSGIRETESFRASSAGWYLLGQVLLFLPQVIYLAVGVVAMNLPPSTAERQGGTSSALQAGLIVAQMMAIGAPLAFWLARRALEHWDAQHTEKYRPSPMAEADHHAVVAAGEAAAAVKAAVDLHKDSPDEGKD